MVFGGYGILNSGLVTVIFRELDEYSIQFSVVNITCNGILSQEGDVTSNTLTSHATASGQKGGERMKRLASLSYVEADLHVSSSIWDGGQGRTCDGYETMSPLVCANKRNEC